MINGGFHDIILLNVLLTWLQILKLRVS